MTTTMKDPTAAVAITVVRSLNVREKKPVMPDDSVPEMQSRTLGCYA
jgi:hypothetical protein